MSRRGARFAKHCSCLKSHFYHHTYTINHRDITISRFPRNHPRTHAIHRPPQARDVDDVAHVATLRASARRARTIRHRKHASTHTRARRRTPRVQSLIVVLTDAPSARPRPRTDDIVSNIISIIFHQKLSQRQHHHQRHDGHHP